MTQPDTDAESPCKRIGVFIETLWQHLDRHTRRDMRLLAALNEANAELARLDKSIPPEVVEQLAVALAEIAGGPWCECDKCRTALAALTAAAPYRKHTNG